MLTKKKSLAKTALVVALMMAVAFVFRMIYEDLPNAMLQAIMCTTRDAIHISLLISWVLSLHRRLVNKNVRRIMLIVGGLMIFWLIDKIVKWDFTGSVTHPLVRYLWYGFYVGMLFVPTLGAFIINYLGKPENYTHPKKLNYLLTPPIIMLIAVFTNDLHQKVFVFYNGFINFDLEYGYDWVYYIVMAWFIIMGFYFVVMMLLKSRVPGSRKLQKMPIAIMAFAALFWIGYSMKLYNCDLTIMDCLIIVLLLESAIQSGLLPSNTRYQEVFDSTTVPVQIVDTEFDSIITGVTEGKYDFGMAGMTVTEDRLKSVNFSTSYAKGVQVIIVKNDSPITSIDDLSAEGATYKIGVQQGTTGDIYASDTPENGGFGEDRVTSYNTGAEAVLALTTGKVDCVIIDNEPAKSFVAANEGIHILAGDNEYAIEDYAICVAKENTALLEQINKALAELTEDGTIAKIIEKYIPSGN